MTQGPVSQPVSTLHASDAGRDKAWKAKHHAAFDGDSSSPASSSSSNRVSGGFSLCRTCACGSGSSPSSQRPQRRSRGAGAAHPKHNRLAESGLARRDAVPQPGRRGALVSARRALGGGGGGGSEALAHRLAGKPMASPARSGTRLGFRCSPPSLTSRWPPVKLAVSDSSTTTVMHRASWRASGEERASLVSSRAEGVATGAVSWAWPRPLGPRRPARHQCASCRSVRPARTPGTDGRPSLAQRHQHGIG